MRRSRSQTKYAMIFPAQIKRVVLLTTALFIVTGCAGAADSVGRVCVQAITTGESWKANGTGAAERSVFTVRIDNLPALQISTNSSGMFTNLSLTTKHTVKIRLDDK